MTEPGTATTEQTAYKLAMLRSTTARVLTGLAEEEQ